MLNISKDYNRKLSNLAKIYTNYIKYSGYINSFILKLTIFHNIYLRVDILLETKIKTFLKSLALDYYYLNINISAVSMNFDQV